MKFAHNFQESLQKEEYPPEWISSAISYRKLKKCIKRVQQELHALGLDRKTLEALWQQVRSVDDTGSTILSSSPSNSVQYSLPERQSATFTPKLTIAIDPLDGSPMDAWLSSETRSYLRGLAYEQGAERRRSVASLEAFDGGQKPLQLGENSSEVVTPAQANDGLNGSQATETIEIPLTSDSEFFQILSRELSNLEHLQQTEQGHLKLQIVKLGHELGALKSSSSKKSRVNIEAWREIFRLYAESQVFFSSNEQDAGARNATHAQTQLHLFTKSLASEQGSGLKLDKSASAALDRFMQINLNLLRFVKFQEINRTALSKILKKFDKQTALRSQISNIQWLVNTPFMAQDLAKATCFTISEELLHIIPQLDDYLCPICFSISFKPVRLRCNHVFCIRCLVVMQRAEQDHCPLCRGLVVLEATSDNLDKSLTTFLKANFPQEVKAKQKSNEFAAGVDRFGEGFKSTHKCVVM